MEKDQALEADHAQEQEKNKAIKAVFAREKDKCLQLLTQSHFRFIRLNEISSYEAFRLGWEKALLGPLELGFSSLDPMTWRIGLRSTTMTLNTILSRRT